MCTIRAPNSPEVFILEKWDMPPTPELHLLVHTSKQIVVKCAEMVFVVSPNLAASGERTLEFCKACKFVYIINKCFLLTKNKPKVWTVFAIVKLKCMTSLCLTLFLYHLVIIENSLWTLSPFVLTRKKPNSVQNIYTDGFRNFQLSYIRTNRPNKHIYNTK